MPKLRTGCPFPLAVALLLLFAATSLAGQAEIVSALQGTPPRDRVPPPRTGTGVVRGRVVDGVTGAAIARARVTLQGGKRAFVTTDGNGAFVFAELPAAQVWIGGAIVIAAGLLILWRERKLGKDRADVSPTSL